MSDQLQSCASRPGTLRTTSVGVVLKRGLLLGGGMAGVGLIAAWAYLLLCLSGFVWRVVFG